MLLPILSILVEHTQVHRSCTLTRSRARMLMILGVSGNMAVLIILSRRLPALDT